MSRLNDLALKYNTDKSSLGHGYCPLYEKHLPEKVNKFLEIGVLKGAGIKMFKEYYNDEGMFYGLDRFIEGHGLITIAELQAVGINCFQGSQSEFWLLETIKEKFTVISEDASHHWLDQIVTFKKMFMDNMEEGGLYVCEDVFSELYWGQGIIKDPKNNMMGIFEQYKRGEGIASEMINQAESDSICSQIAEVNIYPNIVFIKHK